MAYKSLAFTGSQPKDLAIPADVIKSQTIHQHNLRTGEDVKAEDVFWRESTSTSEHDETEYAHFAGVYEV